jgi:hypothetical protein
LDRSEGERKREDMELASDKEFNTLDRNETKRAFVFLFLKAVIHLSVYIV